VSGVTGAREDRFAELFGAHHRAVRHYVIRRAWPDAVDDVVADTFLIAWRRLESIPHDALPWLFTTARNCLSNHRRGALRGAALLTRLAAEPAPAAPDELERAARRDSIVRALARLSDDERELVMLGDWDGVSPRQIAATLGLGAVETRARLYRARRKLRGALDDELGTAHPDPIPRSAHDPA
jgi:RNA polymerase sigma-70 factor (ECF subfamily)